MDKVRRKLLVDMGFSEKAVSILEQNLNMGSMDQPSITVQHNGSCGDILFLSLRISDDVIVDAKYEYVGCAGLQSCASALTQMIKGKTFTEAKQIEAKHIINYLEGIPVQKYECAEIARDTLYQVIEKWENPGLSFV